MKYALVLLLFTSSCMHPRCPWHVEYFEVLTKACSSRIKEKYNVDIDCESKRWERPDPESRIEELYIEISINKIMTIDEARKFLLALADEYLYEINSDETIGPYLVNFPFTYKNLTVHIVFKHNLEEGESLDLVSLNWPFIYYDHDFRFSGFKTMHWEKVDDALEILAKNSER